MSRHLERDVGEDLIGVHVRGCAGAALIPVDEKLIMVLALEYCRSRFLNARQSLWLHRPDVRVCPSGCELYDCPRFHESGIVVDRNSRDLKVLQCTGRLYTVVGICRNRLFPQKVFLDACRSRRRCGLLPWFRG